MERPPKYTLLDPSGQAIAPHIEDVLNSLVPRLLRQFPVLRDELLLIAVLEGAGRKLTNRERQSGPIEKLHSYAWVTVKNTAKSQLRHRRGRLAQRMHKSDENGASLDAVPANIGTPQQIERAILEREVMAHMTPEERRVLIWKKAGLTSEEIAEYRGGSAAAVHTLLSRARQKIRRLLGVERVGARPKHAVDRLNDSDPAAVAHGGTNVEKFDGE